MTSNNKRIAKNTLMLYFRMILIMGVTLYTSRVVLNTLGVEDFGIYNVVGGVVAMFVFLNSAMSTSTSRFITIELGKQDFIQFKKIFNVTIVNHILIAFFIFILAETLGLWFVRTKLVIPIDRMDAALWAYQFSIFTCIMSLLQTPLNAVIIAHEKMSVYAWGSILDSCLKLLLVFLLVYFGIDKLELYAFLLFVVSVLMFFFYFIYIRRSFNYCRYSLVRDKSLYKTMLLYSGWDLLGNFSVLAQGQGLNMLLNIFFGPTVNAARGIAYQVQGAITQFGGGFMVAVRPQIIKYYAQGDIEKMMDLVFQSAKFSFFLLWMFTLPLLLETKYILLLWLDIVPDHVVVFTRIILLVGLINAFRTPFFTVMHAVGHIKMVNMICGLLLVFTLPVSYLFLYLGFPSESVFWITLLINILSTFIEWTLARRAVFFSIKKAFCDIILICITLSIVSSILPIICYTIYPQSIIRLLFICILSFSSVIIIVYFWGIDSVTRSIVNQKIKTFLTCENRN